MKKWKPGSKFRKNANMQTNAHTNSVQNGSDAFPNELMRFRFEATPIWENSQTPSKHAVII